MINLEREQNPMPEQTPEIRNQNFSEVAEGYTEEMAIREAMRCLNCRKKPCVSGCPVNIRIPEFIEQIARGDFEQAYQILSEDSSLPAVCGRVCPQENQCQGNVSGENRENRSLLADWSALPRTGTLLTIKMRNSGRLFPMDTGWRLLARGRQVLPALAIW